MTIPALLDRASEAMYPSFNAYINHLNLMAVDLKGITTQAEVTQEAIDRQLDRYRYDRTLEVTMRLPYELVKGYHDKAPAKGLSILPLCIYALSKTLESL